MPDPNSPSAKLTSLLGYDPGKKSRLTQHLFQDVLKELTDKRTEDAKARARTALTQAIQLQEQMTKAEKDFKGVVEKFNKELGKLIKDIEASVENADHRPPDDDAPAPADPPADPAPAADPPA